MGGDDSQKLLPRRGIHSSPGRSKHPAHYRINTLTKVPRLFHRWARVLDIHGHLTVAITAVLAEPLDYPLLVKTPFPNKLPRVAHRVIAAVANSLVNPVEQFFQILLRTRKFGFRVQLFSGLHTLEKLLFSFLL